MTDTIASILSGGAFTRQQADALRQLLAAALSGALTPADIGVTVQGQDPLLQSIAGLTTAANQGFFLTGADVVSTFSLTSLGRSFLGKATLAEQQAALGIGSGGITWSTSGSASELVPDEAEIVTSAVDKTLPATTSAGQQFIVHANVDGVRIVSNGNVISAIGSGNDLTLAAGETAYLVASAAGTLEIV